MCSTARLLPPRSVSKRGQRLAPRESLFYNVYVTEEVSLGLCARILIGEPLERVTRRLCEWSKKKVHLSPETL